MMRLRFLTATMVILAAIPCMAVAGGFVTAPGSCFPSIVSEPTIYLGYLGSGNGLEVRFESLENVPGLNFDIKHEKDLGGVWIELLSPSRGCSPFGFVWGVAYLASSDGTSDETYAFAAPANPSERQWDTSTQWWHWQIAGTWDFALTLTGISGFRFDSFMVNFKRPDGNAGNIGTAGDGAELTVASYIPYIGLLYRTDAFTGPVRTDVGIIGFPIVLGSIRYRETMGGPGLPIRGLSGSNNFESGHFIEAFVDCSVQSGPWSLGAFGRFSALRGIAKIDFNRDDGTSPSAEFRATLDRQAWIVGGTVGIRF